MSDNLPAPVDSKILIYQSDSGEIRLEVRLQDESVWLTQKMMANLFQKDVRTINEHIKNVYEEGELEPESTIRKFRIVQTSDQTVGQLLRYIGWVKQNLAEDKDEVHGLIICREADEALHYALSTVPNVELRLYEVEFQLKEPEMKLGSRE